MALHVDADTAQLLLDCTGADPDAEMAIQCNRGMAPRQPTDGFTVAEGPLRPVVGVTKLPVTDEPIFYSVFTRRTQGKHVVHSPGVAAQLWQPNEHNVRQWVEEQASGGFGWQLPPRVSMVLGVLDTRFTTECLLASPMPRVRAWALRRVEQAIRAGPH